MTTSRFSAYTPPGLSGVYTKPTSGRSKPICTMRRGGAKANLGV